MDYINFINLFTVINKSAQCNIKPIYDLVSIYFIKAVESFPIMKFINVIAVNYLQVSVMSLNFEAN
jgi:hypothetical protein